MADSSGSPGCRVGLRAADGAAARMMGEADGSAHPTLGEILDVLASEFPERTWSCDPALRDRRIASVEIRG